MNAVHPKYEDQTYKLVLHPNKSIHRAYVSSDVSVQVSFIIHPTYGDITHLWIRRHDSKPIGWTQLQRIKNEILGDEQLAIQVFPKESNLVDQANMYHLWSFPDFGISENGFEF